MKIHKQSFSLSGGVAPNIPFDITVPVGAEFLSAGWQGAGVPLGEFSTEVSVWYKCALYDQGFECRQMIAVETGHHFEQGDLWKFIDTVSMLGGSYVVHIFWRQGGDE